MTKANEEKKSMSFAERFKKKPAFSANSMEQKEETKTFATEKKDNDISKVDPKDRALAPYIYLVKGVDAGRNAWYYVLVDKLKVKLFLKALNDDIIHLENYGEILYSAYGDEPPAEVTDKLKKKYGIK